MEYQFGKWCHGSQAFPNWTECTTKVIDQPLTRIVGWSSSMIFHQYSVYSRYNISISNVLLGLFAFLYSSLFFSFINIISRINHIPIQQSMARTTTPGQVFMATGHCRGSGNTSWPSSMSKPGSGLIGSTNQKSFGLAYRMGPASDVSVFTSPMTTIVGSTINHS